MIEIEGVHFRYRQSDFELSVPQLTIERGETVAVIGPSGSGKTTLLNLVSGILVPDQGSIVVDGTNLANLSESARRHFRVQSIGLVFQEFELLEHLNVLDNILLGCRVTPAVSVTSDLRQRARELADEIGIADKLNRFARQLSQGERQRVAFCRALLLQPPVLLCDEPTGNLDPANKSHVLDILFDYVSRNDTTLLTVTHDHQMLDRFGRTIDFNQWLGRATA